MANNQMEIKIEIANLTRGRIDKKKIERILKEAFFQLVAKGVIQSRIKAEISVVFVGEKRIRKLNSLYRSQNKRTDILSFCYERDGKFLLGELVVCPQVVSQNARKDRVGFKEELAKNLVHGLLHLLGFLHSEKMFSLQSELTKKLKKKKLA